MVRAFHQVLARSPRFERRRDMVPGLLAAGEELLREEERDGEAAVLLRLARRLDPEGPHSRRIQAHLAYLEGKQTLEMGVAEPELFEAALRLDAEHPLAREALEDLTSAAEGRKARRIPLLIGIGLGILALFVLLLTIGRQKPAPASAAPPTA
jgi:hypothetical protein